MKRIVISKLSFRRAGTSRVLLNVLKKMDKSKFEIEILVDLDSAPDNNVKDEIPDWVHYHFLISYDEIQKLDSYKIKSKKNIFYKIYYIYLHHKIKKNAKVRARHILNDIGKVDTFFSFEGTSDKFLSMVKAKKSVIRLVNSITESEKRKKKVKRIGTVLSHYDTVLVTCNEMKNEIVRLYPHIMPNIKMIYNPVDLEKIEEESNKTEDLSLEEKEMLKEKYIIAMGRLNEGQKDFTTLIKAYKEARIKGITEKLYIIGDGEDRLALEKLVKDLCLADNIKFIGRKKEPYVWIKGAELFVHSSKYEGFPNALLEALACGKMIISSDCPTGPREILDGEKCGRLFPVGDVKALCDLMVEYLTDKDKIQILKNAIEKRKEVFDSKVIVTQYENIL